MVSIFSKGFLLLFLFLTSWMGLRYVDWVTVFQVEKVASETEEKLGTLYWELISISEDEIKSKKTREPLEKLISHLCKTNNLDYERIKIHVIDKDLINAFALPDHHLILYSGLILNCNNEAELAGVLGHEIAHMELNHVMKTLVKEVGLSILISASTGGKGTEIIKSTLKTLSSSAYSRMLESEADLESADYLLNANMDPKGLSRFLRKLAREESGMISELSWISTHPESAERAQAIEQYLEDKTPDILPVISDAEWDQLQQSIKNRH